MTDFLHTWKYEVVGVVFVLAGGTLSSLGVLGFESQQISSISSMLSQIFATLLGLIVTAFTVFISLNINRSTSSQLTKLSPEDVEKARAGLKQVSDAFVVTIWTIAIGTIFCLTIYVASGVAPDSSFGKMLAVENPDSVNGWIVSLLFGGTIASTLNVVDSFRALHYLSDI